MSKAKYEDILKAIAETFSLIVLVDLDTGEEIHYRDAGDFGPMDRDFSGLDYFERTRRYCEEYVVPSDRETFLRAMNIDRLKEIIGSKRTVSVRYRAAFGGEEKTAETLYFPFKGSGEHLAVKAVRVIERE